MLNECGQLWVSRAAQALDARLTNHVVDPSVNPALDGRSIQVLPNLSLCSRANFLFHARFILLVFNFQFLEYEFFLNTS